jgi:hypothetical protein
LYSNLAKLFAGRIQRDHQVPIGAYSIFAQSAYLPPPESLGPHEQRVVLLSPMIIKMNRPYGKDDWQYKVPEEFWTSQSATAYIREAGGDANPELTVAFNDGMRFPRSLQGAVTGAVGATQFGPVQLQSAVKENSRFMDLRQLLRLRQRPEESRRIQLTLADFVNYDLKQKYLSQLQTQLNATFRYAFRTTEDEEFVLTLAEGASAALRGGEVVVSAGGTPTDAKARAPFATAGAETAVRLVRRNPRAPAMTWQARELHVRVWPRRGSDRIDISLKLLDVALPGEADSSPVDGPVESESPQARDGEGREPKGVDRAALPITFRVPMPDTLQELERRPLAHYLSPAAAASGNQPRLKHDLLKLRNDLISEVHGRAALALSSLILVSVGCSLGMMFRSGNFLTAFAVSFVPALLAITLIIAGQQTCGNVPYQKVASASDTLRVGVVLIWSGNFVNLLLGTGLLWRLGRT